MKLAVIGNYPPKACGIATFTHSLCRALLSNLTAERINQFVEVIAIEDAGQQHDYPAEVGTILPRNDREAYARTADYINRQGFDLCVIQHEYGIFGGDDGSYLLDLVDRLEVPAVMTCHTVLRDPSDGQRSVLRRLCARVQRVVVMSEMARRFLNEQFGCPTAKIEVIEHGVPEITTEDRATLRERFGWSDRRVLFTFGLLGRGKGIETVVRALPAIAARYPDVLYVVLGKTHPNVVRDHGEEYREWLHALAAELGVADNLRMISEFATEQHLFERLHATDLYVIPYPNEAQITSGTLAYAVGSGAAVVSTPFWHATEILAEERGALFPFNDPEALSQEVLRLLDDEDALTAMRSRALDFGRHTMWPAIGQRYLLTMADARTAFQRLTTAPASAPEYAAPGLRIDHLQRLSDDCGLLQHATYAVPNRHEGYCLDDNGRALLFAMRALQNKDLRHHQRKPLLALAERYLGYICYAQRPDGAFRNFMDYGRNWLEERGSEDSYGRALWGLAACANAAPADRPDLRPVARDCFIRAVHHLDTTASPRALAYGVLGLSELLSGEDNEDLRNLLDRSVNRLLDHYADSRTADWEWFEETLTYSNAILPLALYASLGVLDKERVHRAAATTTAFLTKLQFVGKRLRPVGCHEPLLRGQRPPQFDQQPLEAMALVMLYAAAHRYEKTPRTAALARRAFAWFTGYNDLGVALYNPATHGCYDGLTPYGVNQNQGAESLLAYLLARTEIAPLINETVTEPADRREALRDLLNGFAPAPAAVATKRRPAGVSVSRRAVLQPQAALQRYSAPERGRPAKPNELEIRIPTTTER